jgi:hypothetical protein
MRLFKRLFKNLSKLFVPGRNSRYVFEPDDWDETTDMVNNSSLHAHRKPCRRTYSNDGYFENTEGLTAFEKRCLRVNFNGGYFDRTDGLATTARLFDSDHFDD